MLKVSKILYLINIIIYAVGIPLIIWGGTVWINTTISNMQVDSAGAAIALTFGAIIIIALLFLVCLIAVVCDFVSLIIAIIGFTKATKAKEKKDIKKIGVVSIIFLGNIIPGIIVLCTKEKDFINYKENVEKLSE